MRAASLLLLLTATYGQQQRIAIYVLSTGKSKRLNGTHTEPLHWLTQRALPALDTWAKGFDRVVFVVEKGFEGSAAGRGCRPARDGTLVCPRLADAHLLAADCTDEYRGAGPCCKCDAAFAHAAGAARPWDWVGFADDDVFFDPVGTCVEINQCVGCTVRNRHRHAIEQASMAWTRRKILISTQVGTATPARLHGLRPRRLREARSGRLERVLPAPHYKPKGRGLQGPLPPAAEAGLRRRLAVGA